MGAIASHGDFPVERIKLDRHGKFLGSVSHDDTLKLTDVSEILEDSDDDEGDEEEDAKSDVTVTERAAGDQTHHDDMVDQDDSDQEDQVDEDGDTTMDSDDSDDRREAKRERAKQKRKDKAAAKKQGLIKTKEQEDAEKAEKGFFDDL